MISKTLVICVILALGVALHTEHQQQVVNTTNLTLPEVINTFKTM